jgi:ubiquitin-activating enzyme E1
LAILNNENFYINFILSFSNLRANNYFLEKCDFLTAKEIAGNIIPAIVSTTATITGLCYIQMYNILQTDQLTFFRNSILNLSINEFNLFIPEEKRYIKDFPKTEKILLKKVIQKDFTVRDKIDLYINISEKNLVDNFKINLILI